MSLEEEISDEFECLGIELKSEFRTPCVSLGVKFGLDAETFVENWVAFSMQGGGVAGGMTQKRLDAFEDWLLEQRNKRPGGGRGHGGKRKRPEEEEEEDAMMMSPDDVMLMADTPKVNTSKTKPSLRSISSLASTESQGTPYHSRTKADKALATFQCSDNLKEEWKKTLVPGEDPVGVRPLEGYAMKPYMFGKTQWRAVKEAVSTYIRERLELISKLVPEVPDLDELTPLFTASFQKTFVGGMVKFGSKWDGGERTLRLQGDLEGSMGHLVELELSSNVPDLVVFPGEVIVAEGVSRSVTSFVVNSVYKLPLPAPNVVEARMLKASPLTLMVAAGPYTLSTDLLFSPLKDLLTVVETERPNVLVLLGPFVEASHEPTLKSDEWSFDALLKEISSETRRVCDPLGVHVVMISSWMDANAFPFFPTPPLTKATAGSSFPDPVMFEVGDLGVRVGAVTLDVIKMVSRAELVRGNPTVTGSRLARVIHHMLEQRSFFPLYPPPPDVNVKLAAWMLYSTMLPLDKRPHILLVRSDLGPMVQVVEDVLVLHVRGLCKDAFPGSYAKVQIDPQNLKPGQTFLSGVRAHVCKI